MYYLALNNRDISLCANLCEGISITDNDQGFLNFL